MKKWSLVLVFWLIYLPEAYCWGFFAHQQINYHAVFLLPPEMMVFYKKQLLFLSEHAVDPDKRRYMVAEEGPRHFIDIDRYGKFPYKSLPREWKDAVAVYSEDTLRQHGIVPWWIQTMLFKLTAAFKAKDGPRILKLSAEIGHYIADAHVPLHASSNHNGQLTGQHGIHGFWESRLPEMLAGKEWDYFIGKAEYIDNPLQFIWNRVLESAAAADTVLKVEYQLSRSFPSDQKYAFEERNGVLVRQYSTNYSLRYYEQLNQMPGRRMQQSIYAVASFWYTAWVNAGQPDLKTLINTQFTEADQKDFETLDQQWKDGKIKGKDCN